MNCLYSLLL